MKFGRSIEFVDVNRELREFLIHRGWQVDEGNGAVCWTFSHAYGGKEVSLDPTELDYPDLADFGPHRPAVYLDFDESGIAVLTHGTWKGCDAHRESTRSYRIGERDTRRNLATVIAEVERASANVDPKPFADCLLAGPCGEWFRHWRDRGGSWSDAVGSRR